MNNYIQKAIRTESIEGAKDRLLFVPQQIAKVDSLVKALDYVLILEPGMVHLGNIPFGHMCFGRLVLHYCLCKNLEYALTLKAMPKDFYSELVRTHANGAMGRPVHWEILS